MLNRMTSSNERRTHGGRADGQHSAPDRLREHARRAGRWFAGYLVFLGIISAALIFLMEAFFPEGLPRIAIGVVWAIAWLAGSWWAERHSVYPASASRVLWIAMAIWLGLYLLIIGPPVRWQFDQALVPWAIAALANSLPFFVGAAWMAWRR